MSRSSVGFGILIVAILAIILGPLATIWALNTLFPALAIPYAFETWLAVIFLKGFVAVTVKKD